MKQPYLMWSLVLFLHVSLSAAQERILNFDHDKVGNVAQGWETDGEPWRIVDEPQAPSHPHVLMPPHSVLTGGTLNHLLVSSSTFLNGDVGVRFRTTLEDPPAVFCLLWTYQDAANYEEVEVNTQGNMVSLIATRAGKIHVLAHDSLVFTPNTWHLLQVQALAKQLTVYLDNETILVAKRNVPKNAGSVGLGVVPSSPIQFDDFAWRAL